MEEQIPEIPIQPQEPVLPVDETPVMAKKKFNLNIILPVLGVVLLIGGGAYAFRFFGGPKACSSEAMVCADGSAVGRTGPNCEFAPCPPITVIPAPDEMADWKTYRDEEYGFEFRYPQTFRVEERKKDSSLETDIIAELVGDEKTETEDVFPYVKVVYFNNPENVSLEKYEEYYYKDKIGGMGLNLYFPSDKLIKIDGINARYQENTTCEPLSCSSVVIPYKEKIFAIYIYGDNRDVIYRQILSSFRFIDETADWKTYKNDKYELEFKYPSNYSFFEYDNDQHNIQKLQIFIKKGEAVFLEIWVNKKYLPGDTQYFLDTQSNGIKNISANAWKTYYLSQGYCDGPGCSPPIFALQTEKNNILYSVSFQNQSEITDLQEKILSTFRFTD